MKLRPEEISSILSQELEKYDRDLGVESVGTILQVGDGIARIYGLQDVMAGELIQFPGEIYGMVLNLEEDSVGAAIFGEDTHIKEGDQVTRTGRIAEVPVGDGVIGRVVNAVGQPLDGKGPIPSDETRRIEIKAPGVLGRQPVKEPLMTGLKAVDSMIPIGRGQRELIIGDRQTGKTTVAIDTIINQQGKGVVLRLRGYRPESCRPSPRPCSCALEERRRHGPHHRGGGRSRGARAPCCNTSPPTAGCAMGEFVMEEGVEIEGQTTKDALCVYDDLTKHAWAYREMSLLLRRPPGREAYPGDVFYLHSRLLERAVKLSTRRMAAVRSRRCPSSRRKPTDVSAYIPTNVISITDGQMFLESDLFNAGRAARLERGHLGLARGRLCGPEQGHAQGGRPTEAWTWPSSASWQAFAQFGIRP